MGIKSVIIFHYKEMLFFLLFPPPPQKKSDFLRSSVRIYYVTEWRNTLKISLLNTMQKYIKLKYYKLYNH
jgi:hypothetical protein